MKMGIPMKNDNAQLFVCFPLFLSFSLLSWNKTYRPIQYLQFKKVQIYAEWEGSQFLEEQIFLNPLFHISTISPVKLRHLRLNYFR